MPGTMLPDPSVKSTITRRPDCWPFVTVRSSSHPRYNPSDIGVVPPGRLLGISAIIAALSNPRPAGIGTSTCAPQP